MSDAYIAVGADGAGKKVQTYKNMVNGIEVHAEAFVIVSSAGAPIAVATEGTLASIDGNLVYCDTDNVTVVSSDGLKAADLSIEAVSKHLEVDVKNGVAVTVDGLKASDLSIEAVSKHLEVDVKSSDIQQYSPGAHGGTIKGILAMGQEGLNMRSLICDSSGILFTNTTLTTDTGGRAAADVWHDREAYKKWLIEEGSFEEGWEQGFLKHLYHGRRGAYFESESIADTDFNDWTLPTIVAADNTLATAPWDDVLNVKNSIDDINIDPVYIGLPKAFHAFALVFEANLPDPTGLTGIHIGGEVNRGGSFAGIADLNCESGAWRLEGINYLHAYAAALTTAVTINNPGVYCRYALIYKPPYLRFYQPANGDPSGPLVLSAKLFLNNINGKFIPFFANENPGAICEFRIGNFWVYEILDTPAVTYGVARIDSNTTGSNVEVVAAPGANKTIYVLGYQIQGKGDVEVCLRSAGTDLSTEWDLNSREGAVVPIKEFPYYYLKCASNEALNITLDAAVRVTGNVQYIIVDD